MYVRFLMLVALIMLACPPVSSAGQKIDSSEALAGLKNVKVIFDTRVPDLEKLVFNLGLFNETLDGLVKQGIKPEMVVSFRGPGVRLLKTAELDEEALEMFRELKRKGVRFEACAVAMRTFKVDPAGLIPEIKLVTNVFYSYIGYQTKGYAMIVIN